MKKIEKKLLSVLLILALAFSLAACSGSDDEEDASSVSEESTDTAEVSSYEESEDTDSEDGEGVTFYYDEDGAKRTIYPLTITTYNYEREEVELVIEECPETVYANCQNNIEELIALGLADKIVACSGLDTDIREEYADEFAELTYYDSLISKEEMIDLDPDFIAAWYSTFSDDRLGDVDYWHESGTGTWMSLNSACRGVTGTYEQTVQDEMEDILTLGMIFDVQDRAEEIVAEFEAELEKIDEYVADIDRYEVAILEDEGGTYRVYGEDVLGGNVAISGGAALAVGEKGNTDNISAEDLIAADPYAIYMVWYEGYTVYDEDYAGEQAAELITEDPAFASLQAVQNDRVYAINLVNVYCSGMSTLDGVLTFSQSLYPEIYE